MINMNKKSNDTKSESLTIRMSLKYLTQINLRAQEIGITKSEIVNEAIGEFLQKQNWVPVTIRRDFLAKNIVKKADILHESIQNHTKYHEIEVEMNKIALILNDKSLFTSDNIDGSALIGDIQELLSEIKELDGELHNKCIQILLKKGNKRIVNGRILLL